MKVKKMMMTAIVATVIFALVGCAKDGAQGPAGTNGTNGTNGNANVKVYYFNNPVLSNGSVTESLPLAPATIDSSFVLVYYNPNGNWYTSPGLGANASYQTRTYTTGNVTTTTLYFALYNPDGTAYTGANITINQMKVIVVPGSSFGKTSPVDFNDYKATMKYYGLKAD